MDKDSRDKRFIRKPIFKGGNKEFSKFLYSNLKYPKTALDKKVEGIVVVRYDIDHKGDVIKTKILSSIGFGCDEEAVRVIKLLKFDIPKGPRKLKIIFHRTTKVKFILPKVGNKAPKPKVTQPKLSDTKAAKGMNLSYQYTKKEQPKETTKKEKRQNTYTYNITW